MIWYYIIYNNIILYIIIYKLYIIKLLLYLSEVVWICCNRLRIRWGFIDRFGVSILGNLGYFRWKIAFSQVFVRDLLLDLRSRRNGRNKYDEPSCQIYMNLKIEKKHWGCPSPHSNFRTLPSYQWEGIHFVPRNITKHTTKTQCFWPEGDALQLLYLNIEH